MIKLQEVVKKFGDHIAVNKVSLEIRPGELYSLIGPNGSGKTTIIKMVAGLLRPTGGRILVNDLDTTKEPEKTKSALGYITDEPAIWEGMTGREFLQIVGALWGMSPKEREAKIEENLKLFDLAADLNQPFEDYSRGSKQKLTILAALLHSPKVLLVDEPIVGLDPTSATEAKHLFRNFADKGGAVLLVTHTLPVAAEISDRIGLLDKGSLRAEGSLAELRSSAGLSSHASLEDVYKKLTA